MTSYAATIDTHFPNAMSVPDFLSEVAETVGQLGIVAERTLALVSICRDELTTDFFHAVETEWGSSFTLAGLGGVPALGRTGWQAALAHIPETAGRGALLVFGCPHIGIEEDGSIGFTIRDGQTRPTATCGALSAILAQSRSGELPTAVDPDDYEATSLALRLVDPHLPPSGLVELTMVALDAIEVDLWKAIDEAAVWRDHDVAVFCGVQIHGHDHDDRIWPRDAWYCGADGHRRRLRLGTTHPNALDLGAPVA